MDAEATPLTPPANDLLDASPTAIEAVFEKLLVDVIGGGYPAGARLPPERELARQLGASRPTLREALRRLAEWHLVEPRRGSGIVVLPYRDWSIEVIPAYFKYGKPAAGQPTIARIVLDVLLLRRVVQLDILAMAAPRIPKGGTFAARSAMARAWAAREQPSNFPRIDFEITRALVEAAKFTPALWLLNRLATVWFDATGAVAIAAKPPADYVATHTKLFEIIEKGDVDPNEVRTLMDSYMERTDRDIVTLTQVMV